MKNVLLRLKEIHDDMSETQLSVYNYINKNPQKVTSMTIRELAEETYSSPSTIIRLVREIGFEGFNDFKKELLVDITTLENSTVEDIKIHRTDSITSIINKVIATNIQSLEDTKALLDERVVDQCVNHLIEAETILLFGIGSSFIVASDAFLKFLRLDKSCLIAEDWHTQLVYARNSTKKDVALVFSYSGKTKEIMECMQTLRKNGTPIFAITRYAKTPVAKLADYCIYVSSHESTFRKGAMTSRVTQLNIIDILFTLFINRQYDESMQKIIHTHIDKELQ